MRCDVITAIFYCVLIKKENNWLCHKINYETIGYCNGIKYLGTALDPQLTFHNRVSVLCNKIDKNIFLCTN